MSFDSRVKVAYQMGGGELPIRKLARLASSLPCQSISSHGVETISKHALQIANQFLKNLGIGSVVFVSPETALSSSEHSMCLAYLKSWRSLGCCCIFITHPSRLSSQGLQQASGLRAIPHRGGGGGNPTQHAKGRTGDCPGPSHRGGIWVGGCQAPDPPSLLVRTGGPGSSCL